MNKKESLLTRVQKEIPLHNNAHYVMQLVDEYNQLVIRILDKERKGENPNSTDELRLRSLRTDLNRFAGR